MKKYVENIYEFIKKNIIWIFALVCFIIFLALLEDVLENEIMKGDVIVYDLISRFVIRDSITPIAKAITFLGSAYCLIGLTILLIIFAKSKMIKILIPVNLICITIFNQLLKRLVQRPRPSEYRIIDETGYSFPSGHSMVSMAFYGFLAYLIYKNVKNKYLKYVSIAVLSLQIILIGVSRIYLGVHYTSDVLAGFSLSIFYLVLFIKGINKYFTNKNKSKGDDLNDSNIN